MTERAKALGRAVLTSPGVHFLCLGALIHAAVALLPRADGAPERPALEISAARIDELRRELTFELGRPPAAAELEGAVEKLVDEEVLVRHALDLGLDREPAVEHRLAQIAGFVDAEGDEPAERARELGLHRSDRVVRNILVDRAGRLIRAAVLVREPSEEALEAYLERHRETLRAPATTSMQHLELGSGDEHRAEELLERLRRADERGVEETGVELAGQAVAELPPLTERELARRFGHGFAGRLGDLPTDQWTGPIRSRFGLHLVKITGRFEGEMPVLDSVRREVSGALRQELADRWLEERLSLLRQAYDVRVAAPETEERS